MAGDGQRQSREKVTGREVNRTVQEKQLAHPGTYWWLLRHSGRKRRRLRNPGKTCVVPEIMPVPRLCHQRVSIDTKRYFRIWARLLTREQIEIKQPNGG